MARVTVEDCVLKIPNRFDLVMKAAQRARDISAGAALTIDRDDDKNPVVALREIADETVELSELQESLVAGMQKHVEADEPEEDIADLVQAGISSEASGVVSEQVGEEASAETETVRDGIIGEPAPSPSILYEDVELKD